jgi:hypothetical protein
MLTVKDVERLAEPGRYGDGRGLYLQITPAGVRSWVLRYERGGRERAMGLGPVADFTLDEARERARRARQLLNDGIDPIDARAAERVKAAAERALAAARTRHFGPPPSNITNSSRRNGRTSSTPANSSLRSGLTPIRFLADCRSLGSIRRW